MRACLGAVLGFLSCTCVCGAICHCTHSVCTQFIVVCTVFAPCIRTTPVGRLHVYIRMYIHTNMLSTVCMCAHMQSTWGNVAHICRLCGVICTHFGSHTCGLGNHIGGFSLHTRVHGQVMKVKIPILNAIHHSSCIHVRTQLIPDIKNHEIHNDLFFIAGVLSKRSVC